MLTQSNNTKWLHKVNTQNDDTKWWKNDTKRWNRVIPQSDNKLWGHTMMIKSDDINRWHLEITDDTYYWSDATMWLQKSEYWWQNMMTQSDGRN